MWEIKDGPVAANAPEGRRRATSAGGQSCRQSGLFAQTATASTSSVANDIPPILFVHGNGDHAALWITTLWRMESNGVPRDRMFAINFTDPLARTDDAVAQANRSSTEDQRRELARGHRRIEAAHRRVAHRAGR